MTGVVPFGDAVPGDEAWVYRCPPGEEYAFVTDPEWFDDLDDAVTIRRQRWMLVADETVVFHPRHELCPECHGDGETVVPGRADVDLVRCPLCGGDGDHPLAGQMEIPGRSCAQCGASTDPVFHAESGGLCGICLAVVGGVMMRIVPRSEDPPAPS